MCEIPLPYSQHHAEELLSSFVYKRHENALEVQQGGPNRGQRCTFSTCYLIIFDHFNLCH